ncbi:MAG: FtsX-like permease family protein [Acidobacteria bacterium]|nr:FtsX-like permease family protein [Acidobacteriota bacterium]
MGKFFPLVAKSLLRNVRRTVLTALSVAVSLFLLGSLLAVYAAFYHRPEGADKALRLVTRHKVSLAQSLPAYYGRQIAQVEGVEAVAGASWFGGVYIDSRPEHFFARFACDPDVIFDVYREFDVPPDQLEAFRNDRQGMAVGSTTAERIGLKLGQRITIQGDIYPVDLELTIRAIFSGPDDDTSYFHHKYLDESIPEGRRDRIGFYGIRVASTDDVPRVARAVDEMFRNAPAPTKTETEAAFNLSFINQMGNVKMFLLSIAGAIVFTIMLVSANAMAMSVRERIREVGVLKTLGFTTSGVLGLILSEALLVAGAGGALGVTGAYFATKLMDKLAAGFISGFALPLWGVPICMAAALLIGLGSSFLPALAASRTSIVEALRHNG